MNNYNGRNGNGYQPLAQSTPTKLATIRDKVEKFMELLGDFECVTEDVAQFRMSHPYHTDPSLERRHKRAREAVVKEYEMVIGLRAND